MKLNGFIKKKNKYATKKNNTVTINIPEGLYVQCPKCKGHLYKADLKMHYGVCSLCEYHYPLSAKARLSLIMDKGSFEEFDSDMQSGNPLDFPGYEEKLEKFIQMQTLLLLRIVLPRTMATASSNLLLQQIAQL